MTLIQAILYCKFAVTAQEAKNLILTRLISVDGNVIETDGHTNMLTIMLATGNRKLSYNGQNFTLIVP